MPPKVEAAGWNDCPPPHDSSSRYPGPFDNDRLHLQGKDRLAKRARPVWHAILAARLTENDGSGTTEGMVGALGFFHLRLTASEVHDLLDSARRAVRPVITTPDAPVGSPITGQVLLTDHAADKKFPVRPSARSIGQASAKASVLIWKVFDSAQKPFIAVAALVGVSSTLLTAWLLERGAIIAVGLLLVLLPIVLVQGARTELDRRVAAESWQRLRVYRPCVYAWETHSWRHWVFPAGVWLSTALVGLAVLTGPPIRYGALGGAFVLVALSVVAYVAVVRPLFARRNEEITRVERCRAARGWYGHGGRSGVTESA